MFFSSLIIITGQSWHNISFLLDHYIQSTHNPSSTFQSGFFFDPDFLYWLYDTKFGLTKLLCGSYKGSM